MFSSFCPFYCWLDGLKAWKCRQTNCCGDSFLRRTVQKRQELQSCSTSNRSCLKPRGSQLFITFYLVLWVLVNFIFLLEICLFLSGIFLLRCFKGFGKRPANKLLNRTHAEICRTAKWHKKHVQLGYLVHLILNLPMPLQMQVGARPINPLYSQNTESVHCLHSRGKKKRKYTWG